MKIWKVAIVVLAGAVLVSRACAGQEPPDSARFVASSRGEVYYPVDCPAWRSLSSRNRLFFRTADEAEAAGYARTTHRACADTSGAVASTCVVARIVDGDTVHCRDGSRVRLLLVDAPENEQEDFGLRARLALEELLPVGTEARVELDVQERDPYGRLLAHLHTAEGTWINRALVGRGYAVPLVYPPNVRHVETIRAAADSARTERRGLWEVSAFECVPRDFRAGRCGG